MKKSALLIGLLLLLALPGFSQRREAPVLQHIQDKINWQTSKDTLIEYIKAMEQLQTETPNPYSPDWGKPEAYLYLVKFYRYSNQLGTARKYLDEGLALYPDFKILKSMKKNLETMPQ